jgi:O-succinylbenzoate synthase
MYVIHSVHSNLIFAKPCALQAWASLLTRQTGHYVPTPEFSQELLESTYKALEDFIKQQRDGKSSKSFNKAMHDLYLRVSCVVSLPSVTNMP